MLTIPRRAKSAISVPVFQQSAHSDTSQSVCLCQCVCVCKCVSRKSHSCSVSVVGDLMQPGWRPSGGNVLGNFPPRVLTTCCRGRRRFGIFTVGGFSRAAVEKHGVSSRPRPPDSELPPYAILHRHHSNLPPNSSLPPPARQLMMPAKVFMGRESPFFMYLLSPPSRSSASLCLLFTLLWT